MKTVPISITFNPSKTVAQHIEKVRHISQLSSDELMNDILGNYLDDLFGGEIELLDPYVICRAHNSQKRAEAIAYAYNAFSLATAREHKRTWAAHATVVKKPRGSFYVRVQLMKPLKETTRRGPVLTDTTADTDPVPDRLTVRL